MDAKTVELAAELASRFGADACDLAAELTYQAKLRGETGLAKRLADAAGVLQNSDEPGVANPISIAVR